MMRLVRGKLVRGFALMRSHVSRGLVDCFPEQQRWGLRTRGQCGRSPVTEGVGGGRAGREVAKARTT